MEHFPFYQISPSWTHLNLLLLITESFSLTLFISDLIHHFILLFIYLLLYIIIIIIVVFLFCTYTVMGKN